MNGTGEAGRESHSQDDAPDQRVGVSSSDSGVAIWLDDEIVLRLSWEQKWMLETLLYFEVDPAIARRDLDDDDGDDAPTPVTPEARGIASADHVFRNAGLDRDEPGMEEAYQAVADWFAAEDPATGLVEQGDDDCTDQSDPEHLGPLTER